MTKSENNDIIVLQYGEPKGDTEMIKRTVKFNDIKDVYAFVTEVTKYEGEVDLICGRYRVNAKSIMGIFSLDLLNELEMEIQGENADSLLADIDKYIVK